jgi:hypothetical protein
MKRWKDKDIQEFEVEEEGTQVAYAVDLNDNILFAFMAEMVFFEKIVNVEIYEVDQKISVLIVRLPISAGSWLPDPINVFEWLHKEES